MIRSSGSHGRAGRGQLADLGPDRLVQALVTEYSAGAAIGWHRDKDAFGIPGVESLRYSVTFRSLRVLA